MHLFLPTKLSDYKGRNNNLLKTSVQQKLSFC